MLYLGEKVGIQDMPRGDCLFSAIGATAGTLLSGVKFRGNVIETESIAMRRPAVPCVSSRASIASSKIHLHAGNDAARDGEFVTRLPVPS